MKSKKNFISRNYLSSWNYLKSSKNYIFFVVILFFLFALVGFFFPVPEELSKAIILFIQKLLEKTKDLSGIQLIGFIFWNNLQSCFIGFLFGFFLGITPVLICILNGYVLGFVGNLAVEKRGFYILWTLLPHGIFELPAIFISLGLGLRLGMFLFQKNIVKSLRESFVQGIKTFFLIVIPLLIIAAIIEGSLMTLF